MFVVPQVRRHRCYHRFDTGRFLQPTRGENKAKSKANSGVCLCQRVTTKPKEQMSGLSKKSQIWVFSSHFLLNCFHILNTGDIAGQQLWCGVRVRWCPIMSLEPFAGIGRYQRVAWRVIARPRRITDYAMFKTHHKNPASWKGGREWEEWRCVLRAQQRLETWPPLLVSHGSV